MATKKEKHARALARRAEFEAKERAIGAQAIEADRKRRAIEAERAWDEAHEHHLKKNRFHEGCPNCARVKAKQALEKLTKAVVKQREHYTPDANGKHPGVTGNLLTESLHEGDNTPIDLTREEAKAS